jgi:hypothetical protein
MHDGHHEHMMSEGKAEGVLGSWSYLAGRLTRETAVEASATARSGKHATRTYTNDDVNRVGAKSEPFRKM